MRYSMRRLLIAMTLASIYAGVAFGSPPRLALVLLGLLSFVMPAIYVGGVVYSRRNWRAFWIGTAVCGFIPTLYVDWFVVVFSLEFDEDFWFQLFSRSESSDFVMGVVMLVVAQTLPCLGGLACVVMRRLFKSQRMIMPTTSAES